MPVPASPLPLLGLFNLLLATTCGSGATVCDTAPTETEVTLTVEELATYLDAEGNLSDEMCAQLCIDQGAFADVWETCSVGPATMGSQDVLCMGVLESCSTPGRAGACVGSRGSGRASTELGAYLAASAHAEAASVFSFLTLARELREHGAPAGLIRRARAAARDEVLHARSMLRHAVTHAGRTPPPRQRPMARRSLEEIGRENAMEGCVNETWAALVACHQARTAEDPELRAAFRRIAGDEIRHAELARAVHRWIDPRLTPAARGRMTAAQHQAWTSIGDRVPAISGSLARAAGLPAPGVARSMARALHRALT